MIKVSIQGLDTTIAYLNGQAKQVRYAAAVALTRTAKAVKDAVPAAMERDLDRPTPFSKGGVFVSPARKDNLTATVGFMDRQAGYMKYQIGGGVRSAGPRGIKLPGNIVLNQFGNIPKGLIAKLKAAAQDGSLGRGIAKRLGIKNRRKGAAPIELFYGRPEGKHWHGAPMGIWRRIPGQPGKLLPVIIFENTAAKYRPRFSLMRLASDVVAREWGRQFSAAFAQARGSAR